VLLLLPVDHTPLPSFIALHAYGAALNHEIHDQEVTEMRESCKWQPNSLDSLESLGFVHFNATKLLGVFGFL
jgi:hypothetical protein